MRLRHIEVFQAILQAGSISGAARFLNVSQPNVSRVLSHAEQQVGFALFKRSVQGLTVTEEGSLLIPAITALYAQLQQVQALAEQVRSGQQKTLRLGAAHAFGQLILAPALVKFHRQIPKIKVDIVTEHYHALCQGVIAHELDLALVFGQQVPVGIVADTLFRYGMVAILPKDSPQEGPVSLAWLCAHNLLVMQAEDPLGRVLHQALRQQGLKSSVSLSIKTYSVIADMVVAGGGTGIVDIFTAYRYADQLKILPIPQFLPFEVKLISAADRPESRDALLLRQTLRQACQTLAAQCTALLTH